MARYLEYEEDSGRILCELTSETEPAVQDGHGALEVDESLQIDPANYIVREGALVRARETSAERAERLKQAKERAERGKRRVKSMMNEFVLALLDGNEDAQMRLRKEFQQIKAVL